ncbi:efflux RND transporter permease subunit [Pseudomonas sp. gcc21]|uniref:efflux RND transporter permease subunit n=1 Tax=Pseudomonas sp. gcc21 TaxID=2726989 RepID=UPI001451488D|nr:efflux RND transporter permease subunit [Pseudomonas sp. gcc21]QJD58647.1 efflux RND transporter permease subunit [Pseudomonas sp. gcc21]
MILSDTAVVRPVFATVVAMLLVIFGLVAYSALPLREYPDIDPPIVTIETQYIGAAASVVDSQITQVIEESVAGIEGIEFIESSSEDGQSEITIRFSISRGVDEAANDVRDRVSSVADRLPVEADPSEVEKLDANQDVIIWWNLTSDRLTLPELTDYAERYLVDRFSTLSGVARVRVGGDQAYAMRVWLDREALAARNLTVADVEQALRAENVELPAGTIESIDRQFTVRVARSFTEADEFARLVVARGDNGYLVRLRDVARVERGTEEDRNLFRGNTVPMVGLGLARQSTANTLDISRASRELVDKINPTLPEGMAIQPSFDSSVFIEGAVNEVFSTLVVALILVVLTIFLFLGSPRAILVPAVTLPVSITATFIGLMLFGFTVNLLTLLALVLAIGLVVDDAIIVLENVRRRIDEEGETPLVAAFYGARQVAFAVVSTTLVLIAVFVPIAFLQGDVGRLFSEFALTMAAAVVLSSFVALTLSPMLASKLLKAHEKETWLTRWVELGLRSSRAFYAGILVRVLRHRVLALMIFAGMFAGSAWLFSQLPSEYTPREDRGAFMIIVNGPEGATYEYMREYMDEIESRMMEFVEAGEVSRLLVRAPRSFGAATSFNSGMAIVVLEEWGERRPGSEIMADVQKRLSDLPGVRAFPVMRQGFGSSQDQPFRLVLGGASSYDELAQWRDILLEKIREDNPGLSNIDSDYKETQPQLEVSVDYDRAATLGVNVSHIGRTLETMLGSRRVTTYIDRGEEYDVILEAERDDKRSADSLANIYVRSDTSGELIPLSNLVTLKEFAGSTTLNRYNRNRAITIEASLDDGVALGDALEHVEQLARDNLPETLVIDYKGQSRDLREAGGSLMFVFALGLVVVFLVLAAQFESFVHPLIIMLGVPLAIGGAILGLWLTGNSVNLYSQIGMVMLIGLAAKNGILIVEFANQLRDAGKRFDDALLEAATLRLRPILMTGVTTVAGALPLVFAVGAGAETRAVIGIVVVFGVSMSTLLTLFVIPVLYSLLARNTGSPGDVRHRLDQEDQASLEVR